MHTVEPIKVSRHYLKNYSYLIVDEYTRKASLIDPAWELDKYVRVLSEKDLDLTAILLTHSHFDHVNMVAPLVQMYSAEVFMSSDEINFSRFRCKNLNSVSDCDAVTIGHTSIECHLTPGHTPGSLCFKLSDSVFTGDTVFIEGCGICHAEGGDPYSMFRTFQMLKKEISPELHVYPGHSFGLEPGLRFAALREQNIYFQIDRQDLFVKFRMRVNQPDHLAFR